MPRISCINLPFRAFLCPRTVPGYVKFGLHSQEQFPRTDQNGVDDGDDDDDEDGGDGGDDDDDADDAHMVKK